MKKGNERCKNCTHYREHRDDGVCWRYPPVWVGADYAVGNGWEYPLVSDYFICGEHKPRGGTK